MWDFFSTNRPQLHNKALRLAHTAQHNNTSMRSSNRRQRCSNVVLKQPQQQKLSSGDALQVPASKNIIAKQVFLFAITGINRTRHST